MIWLLLSTAAAAAAEVEVLESEGEENFTKVTFASLVFGAAPAEDNRLSIEVLAKRDAFLELKVLDPQAAIDPGNSCVGGGAPGVAATCTLREPRPPDYVPCGFRPCAAPVPGTGVVGSMRIDLGDGDNVFDGGRFTDAEPSFAMTVTAGSGDDRITTGAGDDSVVPGEGFDQVSSGAGEDAVEATAAPDGPDVYDLGADVFNPARFFADRVSYALRTAPVAWDGSSGVVSGENDTLVGVETIIGGLGDDVLVGSGAEEFLAGGPGEDVLAGGPNWDILVGGDGADRLYGGGENDTLYGEGGNDVGFGGRAGDAIKLGDGSDRALGGAGNDRLGLGSGNDRGDGGPGRDTIRCDAGIDVAIFTREDVLNACETQRHSDGTGLFNRVPAPPASAAARR